MARSLDQIVQELDASYNPSRALINSRIDALPAQGDAEISGLKATQEQAFGDILNGARDRGVAFGGIPLGEQAQYTASTFLPAVAKVKQSQNDVKTSLLDALNGLNLDQQKYAQSLYSGDLAADEQKRQFEAQLAAQKAAAAAASAGFDYTKLASGSGGSQAPAPAKSTDPIQQLAYNDVADRIYNQKANDKALQSDYAATAASAKNGNQKDLYKLQTYRYLRPDLFKFAYPWETAPKIVGNNGGALQF